MANLVDHVDATLNLLNVNMVNITKLTSTNYMTWSLQIHALLDGYDFAGYIDGTKLAPAETITVNKQRSQTGCSLWFIVLQSHPNDRQCCLCPSKTISVSQQQR